MANVASIRSTNSRSNHEILRFGLLFVLLMQFAGHATRLHEVATVGMDHMALANNHTMPHDDTGLPPHEHMTTCVLAGMCMWVAAPTHADASIAMLGLLMVSASHWWAAALLVPTPPPR